MPQQHGGGDYVQLAAVEQLPIECWVSIFEFLDMDELKRISCWISPYVSQSLLESEYNQLFYRRLCEERLKSDLNKVINNILSIERVYTRIGRFRQVGRRFKNVSDQEAGICSMKELRENLRVCVLKSKWLFSNWFTEDDSLDDRIYESVEYSYCLNAESTRRFQYALEEGEEDPKEKLKKDNQMKSKSFMQEVQKQVAKQSRRPVKWKSIWNGHFIWSTHSNLKQASMEFGNRILHDSGMSSMDIFNYLKTTYNWLMVLQPELRRDIMFKLITFTYKLPLNKVVKQSFFSKLVLNISKSVCEMDLPSQELYEKLINLFVEESIEYGVKKPILLDGE